MQIICVPRIVKQSRDTTRRTIFQFPSGSNKFDQKNGSRNNVTFMKVCREINIGKTYGNFSELYGNLR